MWQTLQAVRGEETNTKTGISSRRGCVKGEYKLVARQGFWKLVSLIVGIGRGIGCNYGPMRLMR